MQESNPREDKTRNREEEEINWICIWRNSPVSSSLGAVTCLKLLLSRLRDLRWTRLQTEEGSSSIELSESIQNSIINTNMWEHFWKAKVKDNCQNSPNTPPKKKKKRKSLKQFWRKMTCYWASYQEYFLINTY